MSEPILAEAAILLNATQQRMAVEVPLLSVPGAVLKSIDIEGRRVSGTDLDVEGKRIRVVNTGGAAELRVFVELPGDLLPAASLQERRLEHERELAAAEEVWRRKRFRWTVMSGLLTAAVAVLVAWLGIDRGESMRAKAALPSLDAVQACERSVERLPLIAQANHGTPVALSTAIDRHVGYCSQILEEIALAAAGAGP